MKTTLLMVLIAFAACGCSDKAAEENARKAKLYDEAQSLANNKQKKLEECFAKAEEFARDYRQSELPKYGCTTRLETLSWAAQNQCLAIAQVAREGQEKDEKRCEALYR